MVQINSLECIGPKPLAVNPRTEKGPPKKKRSLMRVLVEPNAFKKPPLPDAVND
jgi:hypothetical protein